MRKALLVLALASCSHAKQEADDVLGKEFKDDLPPAEDLSAAKPEADKLRQALPSFLDPESYVAGRGSEAPDASYEGQGDAALLSGMALLSLSCEAGQPLLAALVKGIHDNGGMIPRHNPLVPSANGPTTRDQVTGVALGFVDRWQRCPADRPAIKEAWTEHVAYVEQMGALGPTSDGALLAFRWLWGAVGQYFGAGGGGGSKQEWEASGAATAESIKTGRKACYPVHIETLQSVLAAKIGKPKSRPGRGSFCEAARGLGLELTEWYCERSPAAPWLASFAPNAWQLQFQRCQGWESPDGQGKLWPGSDFLELYSLAGGG